MKRREIRMRSKRYRCGFVFVVMLTACVLINGCMFKRKKPPEAEMTEEPEIYETGLDDAYKEPASIWRPSRIGLDLFTDSKARRINDIITVRIVETVDASQSATTATSKESEMDMGIENLFGLETKIPEWSNDMISPSTMIKTKGAKSFEGEGSTKRSGNLVATMAARVVDVLPNGYLVIKGHRELVINDERQILSIQGLVRPQDIDDSNCVISTNISDLQVVYGGRGIISADQRRGWLTWMLDWVWPF